MRELLEDAAAFACVSALMMFALFGFKFACWFICKIEGWC